MKTKGKNKRRILNVLSRPDYFTLDELLSRRLFRIPHYQRAYSWHRKQRADMFSDIENIKGTPEDNFHFMATVVGLRRESKRIGSDRYNVIEVVDGQQRLTTLVLLLKAIEQKLECSQPDDAQALQKLLVKGDDLTLILLQTNHDNSHYCSKYLRYGETPAVSDAQTLADKELLSAIHECQSFVVDKWNDPMELLTIVKNQLHFIFYQITDEASVYTVFETLNDRGLDVSWLDKLKNRLMAVVFEENQGNRDEHIHELHEIWGDIYQTVGLQQGLSTEALRFGATLTSSTPLSKPLGEEGAVRSFTEQVGTSTSETLEVSNWLLKVTKAVDKFLGDMRGSREAVTEIAHARLLAVAILLSDFSANDKTKLLNEWEKTTFRIFGLLDKDARTGVGNYVRLAREIWNDPELSTNNILNRIKDIGALYHINDLFDQPENTNWYEGRETELRYLLFRYEEHLAEQRGQQFDNEQWRRIWEDSPARSIEHIFPQSKGSQDPLRDDQEGIYVHRLGNLLLLPPETNSKLGNKDPEEKTSYYRQNGFFSAADVAQTIETQGWGNDQIKEREQRMIAWIREKWG